LKTKVRGKICPRGVASLDREYDLGQKEDKLPHLICLKENSVQLETNEQAQPRAW
jgi:hypothetical protein